MSNILSLIVPSLFETLYMVILSTVFTIILGLPIGILLVVTDKNHILPNKTVNSVLSFIVNIGRSIPFIILNFALIPFTRLVVGTSIGTTAAMVPLVIAAVPFFARVVESSLKELNYGLIEASIAMGASPMEIILKVMLPESIPSLILGVTITIIAQVGYSAMAGAVGGGGLGNLAINYGYYRYKPDVMLSTILVLVVLVMLIQTIGNKLSNKFDKR